MKPTKSSLKRSGQGDHSFNDALIVRSMDSLGTPVMVLAFFAGALYFLFGDRSVPKDLVTGIILLAFLASHLLRVTNRHKLGLQIVLTILWFGFNLNILFFSPYIGLSSIILLLVMFSISIMLSRPWFIATMSATIFIHLLYYFGSQIPVQFLANQPPLDLIDIIMFNIFLLVAGLIGTIYQKTLEETLINAERNLKLFRTVVDQFESAVLILDTKLNIEEMNFYAVRLLDTTYPQAIGKSIYDLIPAEIHEQAMEIFESVYENSGISGVQLEVQSNNDDPLFLKVSAQMLPTEKNVPAYIMLNIINMTRQKMTEQRIQRLAFIDHLTQVNNRLSFNYKLNSLVSKMNRDGGTFVLIYFDLNEFKSVNDERGHLVGDQVLQEFAQRLRNVTRGEDFIARIGGDEFVLLIENLPSDSHVERTLARLRVALNMPYQVEGGAFSLSVSFGISKFPDDGDDAEMLLKQADKAMYADKSIESI